MKDAIKVILILLLTAILTACGGGSSSSSMSSTANSAPVANAGLDQNLPTTYLVQLNGSSSTDANGDSLSYNWSITSKPAGSTASLSSASAVNPTFTADVDGSYVVQLIVNDGTVNSVTDTVTITATSLTDNSAPVANAGIDQYVATTSTVTLNGSASSDSDGDMLTYSWHITSKPAVSNASLSNATVINPTFVADLDGTYVIQLIVNDGTVNSAIDTVTITALTGNSAPVAIAGIDQNVDTGSTVTLDGSGSSDPNSDNITYSWTLTVKPVESSTMLSNAATINPSFIADKDGSYTVQLITNDGELDSTVDTVIITAVTPNSIPMATSTAFTTSEDIPLNGTLSGVDNDGDTLTFIKNANAVHGTVTIDSNGTFSYMPNTDYFGSDSFSYKVNDGQDDSNIQEVLVTVQAVNDSPVVYDQSQIGHARAILRGDVSASDPENDFLTYVLKTPPSFGSFTIDSSSGDFTFKAEGADGSTFAVVEVSDGEFTVDANLTFNISAFDLANSIEMCDSYKLYSNNFTVEAGLIQAYSYATINISNMVDSNITINSAVLYNGENKIISQLYGNVIEPGYFLKVTANYSSDVTELENFWIIKFTDLFTGASYISKYTYDSFENMSISHSAYISSTGPIGCYTDTPYRGTYITEKYLNFDIAPIEDVIVSTTKTISIELNDAIVNNDANITVSVSPSEGLDANYSDGNVTLLVIDAEQQSSSYTVIVTVEKGLNRDVETFNVEYAVQHNVSTTSELRSALLSAAGNGYSDIIVLADGTYATTDDTLGEFSFNDNETHKLNITGSGPSNVILSGNNTDRVLHLYNAQSGTFFTIENLTIQDGYVNDSTYDSGAGISSNIDLYCNNIIVRNNHLIGTNQKYGGGISTTEFVNFHANLWLNNSLIENNSAQFGGGFMAFNANIKDSIIRGNTAGNSAGGFSATYAQVYNTIIASNVSDASTLNGGAFHTFNSLSLVNSLIIDNDTGASIYSGDSNYIVNSIFSNNGTFDVKTTDSASVVVSNTYTDGIWDIPHFDTEVMTNGILGFVDSANFDFRLTASSDLVDAGTNGHHGVEIPLFDIHRNSRPVGLSTDIGPYEYQP